MNMVYMYIYVSISKSGMSISGMGVSHSKATCISFHQKQHYGAVS